MTKQVTQKQFQNWLNKQDEQREIELLIPSKCLGKVFLKEHFGLPIVCFSAYFGYDTSYNEIEVPEWLGDFISKLIDLTDGRKTCSFTIKEIKEEFEK